MACSRCHPCRQTAAGLVLLALLLLVAVVDSRVSVAEGRHLKTHQPRQGRKVQQLAAAARAGLGQLAAELGETVAGNLKSTAGNAVLGLVQDGLNAIPGPLGSIAATTLDFLGLGGGGSGGISPSQVEDIVNAAADRIINTLETSLQQSTTAIIGTLKQYIRQTLDGQTLQRAVAAIKAYQNFLADYKSSVSTSTVQQRLKDLGSPTSSKTTIITELTTILSEIEVLMSTVTETIPDAMPIYMAGATYHLNYLVEYATLFSTVPSNNYQARQSKWLLVIKYAAQYGAKSRSIQDKVLPAPSAQEDTADPVFVFLGPLNLRHYNGTDVWNTWTDISQTVLDSGYFSIDVSQGLPRKGQLPANFFKLWSNTVAHDGIFKSARYQGSDALRAILTRTPPRAYTPPVRTDDLLKCIHLCAAAPGCRGFEHIYDMLFYIPFTNPDDPSIQGPQAGACFIDHGTTQATNATYNDTAYIKEHPDAVAPGSASLVARFTTDNANKGDQYYVAAWPGRYTSPPPKVVDGRCTLGEQLRPKNCTLPGNPPAYSLTADVISCLATCEQYYAPPDGTDPVKYSSPNSGNGGQGTCELAFYDAGIGACYITAMPWLNANWGTTMRGQDIASVSGVKTTTDMGLLDFNLTDFGVWGG